MVTQEGNGIYVSHIDDVYADGVEFTLSISLNGCYDVSRHLDDFSPDDNAGNYRKGVLLNYVGFQVLRHEGANATLMNNPSGWVDVTAWAVGSSVGSDCLADKYGNGDISIRVGGHAYTPLTPEALFTKYSVDDEPYSYWYNGVSEVHTDIEYAFNFGSYFSAGDWADADFREHTLDWFGNDEVRASHRGLDSDDDTSATVEIRYKFPDTYPYGDWQEADQHTYCIIFKYPVSENEWGSEISYIQPYDENNVISYRTQLLPSGDYAPPPKCRPVDDVDAVIASGSADYNRYDLSIRCRDGIDTTNASVKFYLQVVKENAYRITSSSGEGGSISPVEGTVYAPKGSDRRYTVVPDEGHRISEFLVDGQASVLEENNNYTFRRILRDHTIYAEFEDISGKRLLVVRFGARNYNTGDVVWNSGCTVYVNDVIVPESGSEIYVDDGSRPVITIAHELGYESATVTELGATRVVTGDVLDDDEYVYEPIEHNSEFTVVVHKDNPLVLETQAMPPEGGTTSPLRRYCYAGETIPIHAEPYEGWRFDRWIYGDELDSPDRDTEFVMPYHSVLLDAHFSREAVSYSIYSMVNGTGGTIEPIDTITVPEGETRVYVVTPDEGYVVDSVIVDAASQTLVDNTYTFENVQSNHTIIVSFAEAPEPPANTVTFHCFDIIEGEAVILDGNPRGEVVQDGTSLAFGVAYPLASGDAFKFIPLSGLFITELHLGSVDGESIMESLVPDRTYIFGEVDGDKEVYVRFNKDGAIDVATLEYPTGAGETTGSGQYSYSETVEVSATPNANYEFLNWTKDGEVVCTERAYSFDVYESVTLIANFASTLPRYSVGVTASPAGGGTATGGGEYDEGSLVTLVATANSGYIFTGWSDGNTDSTRIITVTADATYVANFVAERRITVVATGNSSVDIDGTPLSAGDFMVVPDGSSPVLTVAPQYGFEVSSVYVDSTEVTLVDGHYTFGLISADHTVKVITKITPSYLVKVQCDPDKGTVSGGGTYMRGVQVTVNAQANENYAFVNWTENGTAVSTDAEYTFTMPDDNRILTAHFISTIPRYAIGVSATAGGTASGGGEYDEGSLVTIVAEASEGYHFVGWVDGNGEPVSADPTYSFTADSDMVFVAQFDINQYTINVGVSSMRDFEGAVGCDDIPTHSGDFQVNGVQHGSAPVFYIKENPNGGIESVVVDKTLATERVVTGELVATQYQNQYTYTLPPVTANCSVDIRFNKNGALRIPLSIVPSGAGTVTANGQPVSSDMLYSYDGQAVEFHAVSSAGYSFGGWSIDGVQVSTDADMTYAQDDRVHIIEAVFT